MVARALFFIVCWALAASSLRAQAADHVVLISVDGLRPEFYRDAGWPAPTMQWLAAGGASADGVRGVYPTVTYPSHTTIVTGALPARHGIHYNEPFEPDGATGVWFWDEERIAVPTLWDAVRAAGGTTAAVTWPVTVGAPIDFNVPEVWKVDGSMDSVAAIRAATRPAGLLEEIEREATGRLTTDNFTIDHMTRDDRAGAAAAWLFERHRPTLLAVHLISTDHFQHEDGRDSPRVRRAVGAADRAIGQIYEAVERSGLLERTAIIVTGDHGFVDIHSELRPNVWLAKAGLTAEPRAGSGWRAAFHCASASAFLHLREGTDRSVVAEVRRALDGQPRGERRLFRIVERAELDRLGAAPDAALALALVPGVKCGPASEGPVLAPATGGTHGYHPLLPQIQTGFVGWGAGLRPGARAPSLPMENIAGIIARLLALDFTAPDGGVPEGLLEPSSPPGRSRSTRP